MSFINKYRIEKINDLLSNENNKELLNGFILNKDRPHSYLFFGDHGCGKTTTARIMAKELNCEIIEINGSNDRGISTIRETIYEGSQFKTLLGNNKAYIMDEVHSLLALSQEALLKILEEPPKHVYFFLCTTDPQKLKNTIRSRCTQIEMEKISLRDLYPYLINISIKENNEISKQVARQIAETSEGHVRDSLNILEKVLQFKDEKKQLEIANQKIENDENIIDLCKLLLKDDFFTDGIKKILLSLQSENPESIRKIIINYMQKVLLNNSGKDMIRAAVIIECLDKIVYDYAVLCANIFKIFI